VRAACLRPAAHGRRRILAWLGGSLACFRPATTRAASPAWPPKRLQIVVAYPPGGVSSEVARDLAQLLERRYATTVIIEHRPGAGGALAMDFVARSAPDGATLGFSAITPLTLAPLLGPVPYDPVRDVAAVMAVMATPVLLLGTRALQADSLAGAIEQARLAPGSVRWATSGAGTTGHMVLERIAAARRVVFTHVPYKGGGQQITDALGGHFELLSSNVAGTQLQLVREGRLKPLAVSGEVRIAALPEVPTLAELGLADASLVSVFGLFACGRTPAALVGRMNAALAAVLRDPVLQQRLAETSNLPLGGSPATFEQHIAREREQHRAWLAGERAPARAR
jgi:tripartite-type tricarboxylate transporter receptor subunit TctC